MLNISVCLNNSMYRIFYLDIYLEYLDIVYKWLRCRFYCVVFFYIFFFVS